jgi:hypothetical protein
VIVDEAVRGHVPPAWFWALPGIDRIRTFDQSQLPSPPIGRLLGIRAGHVGPGSGTWVMPATGWNRGQHSLKGMPGEWRLFSLVDYVVTPGSQPTN